MNFYNYYITLCNKKGEKPSRVALNIGLSKTAVNSWKIGKSLPTDSTLQMLSDYFEIPFEQFMACEDIANARTQKSKKAFLAPIGVRNDYEAVYDAIKEKLPDDPTDSLAEELQILMENPATRTLLLAGRHLSEDQINNFARIMQAMPEGENVANRKR